LRDEISPKSPCKQILKHTKCLPPYWQNKAKCIKYNACKIRHEQAISGNTSLVKDVKMYFEYNNFPTNAILIMISAINLNSSTCSSTTINLKYGSVERDSNSIQQQIFLVTSK